MYNLSKVRGCNPPPELKNGSIRGRVIFGREGKRRRIYFSPNDPNLWCCEWCIINKDVQQERTFLAVILLKPNVDLPPVNE